MLCSTQWTLLLIVNKFLGGKVLLSKYDLSMASQKNLTGKLILKSFVPSPKICYIKGQLKWKYFL